MTKTLFVSSAFSFRLNDTVYTLTAYSQPSAYPPRSIWLLQMSVATLSFFLLLNFLTIWSFAL